MTVFVNGRPQSGPSRVMYIGIAARTLVDAYELAIYEGEYNADNPVDESALTRGALGAAASGNAIETIPFNEFSLHWENGDNADDVTFQVYVSNALQKPPTDPSDMDTIAHGWALLGGDTVSNSSAEVVQWTGRYRWLAIIAKCDTGSATAADQLAALNMTHS